MIQNRLEKNWKKLEQWSKQSKIEAFRIYDHDIPEFPFFIDKYREYFVVYDRTDGRDEGKNQLPQVIAALKAIFSATDDSIVIKKRERQKTDQYTRLSESNRFIVIQESQAKLKVNLWDYLDTGLFLDHRPIRQTIFKSAKGKRFLNLFCYTGSVSVFAALGGATVTSVDMSNTYIDWCKENFAENSIPVSAHKFIVQNALEYLQEPTSEKFDLIFLDPPTFSNSKRMDGTFEVERDQEFIVEACLQRLSPDGILYFSNNKENFKISKNLTSKYLINDITLDTIPRDFHRNKVHCCFKITEKATSKP